MSKIFKNNIKFGIMGLGSIAHTFSKMLNNQNIAIKGVASRKLSKATEFSKQYHATTAYGSYAELVNDPDIDVIYIATPHALHYENMKLCINAKKHILCEKAFTLTLSQAEEIVRLARENHIYILEAMWTRFLPAIIAIIDLVNTKVYGEIISLKAEFGFFGRTKRLLDKSLGGGAMLDIGIYPLTLANLLLGTPVSMECKSKISGGVDTEDEFKCFHAGGAVSELKCSFLSDCSNDALLEFKEKTIIIPHFWKAEKYTITDKITKEIKTVEHPFIYNGYEYEAMAVISDLKDKKLENKIFPLNDTLCIMKQMEEMLKKNGVEY